MCYNVLTSAGWIDVDHTARHRNHYLHIFHLEINWVISMRAYHLLVVHSLSSRLHFSSLYLLHTNENKRLTTFPMVCLGPTFTVNFPLPSVKVN